MAASGDLLDLREVCPLDINAMLREDLDRPLWSSWCAEAQEERGELAPRPYIEAAQQAVGIMRGQGWMQLAK